MDISLIILIPTLSISIASPLSPISILIVILIIIWFISLNYLFNGSNSWPLIYIIILISGGLIILYLFIISITPNENNNNNNNFFHFLIISTISITPWNNTLSQINNLLSISTWIIIFLTSIISVISFFIFCLIIDPFNTINSSF